MRGFDADYDVDCPKCDRSTNLHCQSEGCAWRVCGICRVLGRQLPDGEWHWVKKETLKNRK